MSNVISILAIVFTLLICVANYYSMNSFRFSSKKVFLYFAAVTLFCVILNSFITIYWGRATMKTLLIFTVCLPYLLIAIILLKSKTPQAFFNFWLWVSFYSLISYIAEAFNRITFDSAYFEQFFVFILLCAYFFIYNRYFKATHRLFMESLKVNWWLFFPIPMTFTLLIWLTKYSLQKSYGSYYQYHIVTLIYILMLLVYAMIVYTFKAIETSTDNKIYSQNINKQIIQLKKQYDAQLEREDMERIYRHDQRFRNSILMKYLESGDIESAKAFINQENTKMAEKAPVMLCENALINATLIEYRSKALQKGLHFSASVQLPETISCGEAEFCVMLSNFLENSFEAANKYINIKIKHFNSQLSISIENDYNGELKKDDDGWYITTKPQGSGLGLKSADLLLKNNHGFLKTEDDNGIFKLFATMKN